MSNSYINQITIDCLLNKEALEEYSIKEKTRQINNKELNFYRKRICKLFTEIIKKNQSSDIPPDIEYAYNTFIKAAINHFKVEDNNDLLQEEYKDVEFSSDDIDAENYDPCKDLNDNNKADKLLMRSIKMELPTLDKYVKRTYVKKEENIILPKSRGVDVMIPELKNKGLKN